MIWQLMKRDPVWKGLMAVTTVMFALMAVVAEFLPLPASQPSRDALRAALAIVPAVAMGWLVFLVFNAQSQRNLYEAALPIAGRDAWLSRVLSLLALIWLPLSIAIALGLPPLPLLQAGAVYTLLVLAVKCIRIRELEVPRWLRTAGFRVAILAFFAGPYIAKRLKSANWFVLPPAGSVLTVCALAGVALFWWGWTTVPKSFQIAPPESGLLRRSETQEPSKFTWAPVFRSIYGRPMLLVILFLLGNIVFGLLWTASLVVGGVQVQIRGQCRWLLALPISFRNLFGWIAIPQTAAVVAGCLAGIFIDTGHPLSPTARLVEMAAELAVLYGMIFLSELSAWRRLSKLRAARWGVWILWTPFAVGAVAPAVALPDTNAIQRLAGVLPANWWQLAVILVIPVIVTYWLAEKAFREQEYRQLLVELDRYRRNSI